MLVFVYGSLKKGFYNHPLISQFKQIAKGKINGRMYSLGSFPAIVLSDDPSDVVVGEVYDVTTDVGLRRLDRLEGYDPNSNFNFYTRSEVKCMTDDGRQLDVMVYHFLDDRQMSLRQRRRVEDGIWKEGAYF